MSEFKIDDKTYDTEKLNDTQKRIIALYQQALREEAECLAKLEISRAARVELGRRLKSDVIEAESETSS